MKRRRLATIIVILLCLPTLATAKFVSTSGGETTNDEPSQDSSSQPRNPKKREISKEIGEDRSWSLLSFAPTTALLRELAAARGDRAINLPYEILKLSARSVGAATAELSAIAVNMAPFRSRNNEYTFSRPSDWRENAAGAGALREEQLLAGEMFVSPESDAFLSSGYRRITLRTSRDSITPEALIDRLLWKLRRLPGVDDARETTRTISIEKGILRAQVGLEVNFRPSLNDPPIPFLGRAVILRNPEGIFELIGLRQPVSPSSTAKLIDLALDSAVLRTSSQ
jgi:hypothetical protein